MKSKEDVLYGPLDERGSRRFNLARSFRGEDWALVVAGVDRGYVLDWAGPALRYLFDRDEQIAHELVGDPQNAGFGLFLVRGRLRTTAHSSPTYGYDWDEDWDVLEARRLTPVELEAFEEHGTPPDPLRLQKEAERLWLTVEEVLYMGASIQVAGDGQWLDVNVYPEPDRPTDDLVRLTIPPTDEELEHLDEAMDERFRWLDERERDRLRRSGEDCEACKFPPGAKGVKHTCSSNRIVEMPPKWKESYGW